MQLKIYTVHGSLWILNMSHLQYACSCVQNWIISQAKLTKRLLPWRSTANKWIHLASVVRSHTCWGFILKTIKRTSENLHIQWVHPEISTDNSITSLEASKIMSCGITVSPCENSLPSPGTQLDSSDSDCTAAHSTLIFHQQSFSRGSDFL